MGSRMTSRDEADQLRVGIGSAFDALEEMGFTRGQIAAAMVGISLSEYLKHNGPTEALRVWDGLRGMVLAETARSALSPSHRDT